MKKKFLRHVLCLCLALPVVVFAQSYRINLLIFTHVTPQTLSAESWRPFLYSPGEYAKYPVLSLATNQGAQDFQLIPGTQNELRGIGRLLSRKGDHILLDVAWQQSNTESPRWLHIYAGQAYDSAGNVMSVDRNIHGFTVNPDAKYWEIDGAVKVTIGRFILADLKMNLNLPVSQVSGVSNSDFGQNEQLVPLQSFSINQSQRMLLNHFVYFDHPLYGVLMYVQRL